MSEGLTEFWQGIALAVSIIAQGNADRMDGAGWKVYRAGTIIRIDLTSEAVERGR